jgi:4a-hydroxytetrahydrobiopterin dehydratase
MSEWISPKQFFQAGGTEDWGVLGEGACTHFPASFADSIRLAHELGALDGLENHKPDLDIRHDGMTVRLITITHEGYGLIAHDVELARRISAVARSLGLVAEPSAVQTVQVAVDALDIPRVLPFWAAVLGYDVRDVEETDLIDPRTRGAPFWFQQMGEPRPQRNRIHIDVFVPYDVAEARVTAALAAGGTLVSDAHAPEWWTLADPEGNEVDVATTHSRN